METHTFIAVLISVCYIDAYIFILRFHFINICNNSIILFLFILYLYLISKLTFQKQIHLKLCATSDILDSKIYISFTEKISFSIFQIYYEYKNVERTKHFLYGKTSFSTFYSHLSL